MTYELPEVVDPDSSYLMVHIEGTEEIPALKIESPQELSVQFSEETQ